MLHILNAHIDTRHHFVLDNSVWSFVLYPKLRSSGILFASILVLKDGIVAPIVVTYCSLYAICYVFVLVGDHIYI